MQAEQWDEAIRLLESTIEMASPDLGAAALEVLASIYVARNEHVRLRDLLSRHVPVTPQMISGALLLTRNHAIGIDGEVPPSCCRRHVESTLRRHVVAGSYQPGELLIILALLAQIGWSDTARDIATLCVSAGIDIEAGLLESVLAMLLGDGQREAAIRLLDTLRGRPDGSRYPIPRWALLVENETAQSAAQIPLTSDKVVRFLHRAGER
jgi:hypothetical protein